METRKVISKSAKRKMSTLTKKKPNAYTEMVVYTQTLSNGKKVSRTRHEPIYN